MASLVVFPLVDLRMFKMFEANMWDRQSVAHLVQP